jgi:thiol-disulfide isomerase/thioredoxin
MNAHEIIMDAGRRRDTERVYNGLYSHTYILNQSESVTIQGDYAYILDAKDGGQHYLGFLDFAYWEFPDFAYWPPSGGQAARSDARPGANPAVRRIEGADGRLTIESETESGTARWIVDRATGFVHAYSRRTRPGPLSQVVGEEVRQYGPKAFADGAVLPTVHVAAKLAGDRVEYLLVKVIDDVDLAYHPGPLDFVLAVPAGTVIVDSRESRKSPNKGTAHYPVADVVGYAEEMASRYNSIEPVVNVGEPAPPIHPAAWFDWDGPAAAPAPAGKVVLVDFWGITCGPCMAELPEVQAAADRFAGRSEDFVLIGLHNSGAPAEHGTLFARNRGLTYRLAIDRPASEEGWVGATFQAYGIRPHAVPAAAVIDRQGKVAFVGPFREALRKAADLLGPE